MDEDPEIRCEHQTAQRKPSISKEYFGNSFMLKNWDMNPDCISVPTSHILPLVMLSSFEFSLSIFFLPL